MDCEDVPRLIHTFVSEGDGLTTELDCARVRRMLHVDFRRGLVEFVLIMALNGGIGEGSLFAFLSSELHQKMADSLTRSSGHKMSESYYEGTIANGEGEVKRGTRY